MSDTNQTAVYQPSGFCDGCIHGVPFDNACGQCTSEIVAGLASDSAERLLEALELMARRDARKMAEYRFHGHDTLAVIHRENAAWGQQEERSRTGDYAYRMLWARPDGVVWMPSEGLPNGRESALRLLAAAKEGRVTRELLREPVEPAHEVFR